MRDVGASPGESSGRRSAGIQYPPLPRHPRFQPDPQCFVFPGAACSLQSPERNLLVEVTLVTHHKAQQGAPGRDAAEGTAQLSLAGRELSRCAHLSIFRKKRGRCLLDLGQVL